MVATKVLNTITADVEKFNAKGFELASNETFLSKNASGVLEWSSVDASDPTAFHNNVDNEVNTLTNKETIVSADVLMIEDSEDSWSKKSCYIPDLRDAMDIQDFQFELRTDDLSAIPAFLGRTWIRTDLNDVARIVTVGVAGTWTGGGNLDTQRSSLGGAGTQTAGLAFGGYDGFSALDSTEEYNGVAWSAIAGGDLGTQRENIGSCGTQTAGLAFGGYDSSSLLDSTEEYNGATWSAGGRLSEVKYRLAGAGTQTAGLAFGGSTGGAYFTTTEEYNGATWSAGGALMIARGRLTGAGTQTAGLAFGGYVDVSNWTDSTEEYSGVAWSAGGALMAARGDAGGAGTQTAGLAFGGYNGSGMTSTEEYSGVAWSAGGALMAARYHMTGAGIMSAGLSFGGNGISDATEEYNATIAYSVKTFTLT